MTLELLHKHKFKAGSVLLSGLIELIKICVDEPHVALFYEILIE